MRPAPTAPSACRRYLHPLGSRDHDCQPSAGGTKWSPSPSIGLLVLSTEWRTRRIDIAARNDHLSRCTGQRRREKEAQFVELNANIEKPADGDSKSKQTVICENHAIVNTLVHTHTHTMGKGGRGQAGTQVLDSVPLFHRSFWMCVSRGESMARQA